MNINTVSSQADELVILKNKYRVLTGMVFGLLILWTATIVLQFTDIVKASEKTNETKAATTQNSESLRVREIVVVDEKGTPRVRIGAPLPDPIMLGRRSKRNGDVSGIILYDGEGNERGGYVTGERSIALTMDEINRAAVHLGVNDKGEMHLRFSNGRGGFLGMGVVPTGSWMQFAAPGKPSLILPNALEEEKKEGEKK